MKNDNTGNLSEADILRLHQEQDPASPLFKGSQPAGGSIPGATAEGTEPDTAYYEPTADKVDPIADAIPDPAGTTSFTTEEVSKPYEAPEPVIEPEVGLTNGGQISEPQAEIPPASSETAQAFAPVTPAEDAGITGA